MQARYQLRHETAHTESEATGSEGRKIVLVDGVCCHSVDARQHQEIIGRMRGRCFGSSDVWVDLDSTFTHRHHVLEGQSPLEDDVTNSICVLQFARNSDSDSDPWDLPRLPRCQILLGSTATTPSNHPGWHVQQLSSFKLHTKHGALSCTTTCSSLSPRTDDPDRIAQTLTGSLREGCRRENGDCLEARTNGELQALSSATARAPHMPSPHMAG
eukprot:355412-Chlamydomonas_euryale.AAC.2